MAGSGKMSPRQRMINLMYIVLTAMLALNVSSDVLNGFSQVQESLQRTAGNISARNEVQFKYLAELYAKNPTKTGPWYEKGVSVRKNSNQLYSLIDSLKLEIVRNADGKDADVNNIINKDNLEASSVVMLNPTTLKGKMLRERVDAYREFILTMIPDSAKKSAVAQMLSTTVKQKLGTVGPTKWEEVKFDNVPVIAAVTILTQLQNDLRQAESEALGSLITNVDIGDVRVNELSAYVIPNSNMIMRGGKYSANIVLAAIDTTQRPTIYVGGKKIENGLYEFVPTAVGSFDYNGYIEVPKGDGTLDRREFTSHYTVIEPMATISATMMNVLYAGIDNPISISVPGVAMNEITATMTNGTLTRNGDLWVARPNKIGEEAVITVSAATQNGTQQMGSMTFRVRKLPDPSPFIAIKDASGNVVNYKGTPKRISKGSLMAATGLGAALDDDLLNISYSVVSFTTVFFDSMGNAMPEVSDGAKFSSRQMEQFKRLKPGKSFFITNVKAKGPDGITRDISPMEVALN